MFGVLCLGILTATAAGQDCVFPTEWDGKSMDGCTSDGHEDEKPWCYTDSSGHWKECEKSDDACMFPFTYKGEEHRECIMVDHDAPWCYLVGGGWKDCEGSAGPPAGGSFGKSTGTNGWVDDHNHFRAQHGAAPVAWDSDLAKKAQDWANNLNRRNSMFHSESYKLWPASGENLAWGYGSGCSAGENEGGPKLYNGAYDQHCVVASWYAEYYLWRGSGRWQKVSGIGHFTAMVWKGIDLIGCAQAGQYYVCEYGSKQCKSQETYGGSDCWGVEPSHLPNFNSQKCSNGVCVQGLFDLAGLQSSFVHEPMTGMARTLVTCAAFLLLAAGAVLLVRRLRARVPVRLERDGDEELCASPVLASQGALDE